MIDSKTADKIEFWQGQHAEAGRMLISWLMYSPATVDYYSADDHAYIVAWQMRQAFCYRQVVRHRGF